MTAERDSGHREITRRLRDELARIRTAEAQVEQALQSVRAARRRVEDLALSMELDDERVRALVREELASAGEPRRPAGAPAAKAERAAGSAGPAGLPWRSAPEDRTRWPGSAAGSSTPTPAERRREPRSAAPAAGGRPAAPERAETAGPGGRRERRRLALVAVAAALTVMVVGWLAFQGLRGGVAPGPLVLSQDAGSPEGGAAATDQEEAEPPAAAAASPLAELPETPEAQEELYDSLFAARSPLFQPLLDSVRAATDDRDVENAVAAWVEDDELSAMERDVVQSALVQWILSREIDQRVEVDGELLRNPCRGTSCSALLNIWQMGREAFGFPEMPDDAPTNAGLLSTVEAMLVLERMQDLHVGEGVAASRAGGS